MMTWCMGFPVFTFDQLQIGAEIEQQRPALEELRKLGHKLSEDGFNKLVEPRLIPINKRWERLDLKFSEVHRFSVSLLEKCSLMIAALFIY